MWLIIVYSYNMYQQCFFFIHKQSIYLFIYYLSLHNCQCYILFRSQLSMWYSLSSQLSMWYFLTFTTVNVIFFIITTVNVIFFIITTVNMIFFIITTVILFKWVLSNSDLILLKNIVQLFRFLVKKWNISQSKTLSFIHKPVTKGDKIISSFCLGKGWVWED